MTGQLKFHICRGKSFKILRELVENYTSDDTEDQFHS